MKKILFNGLVALIAFATAQAADKTVTVRVTRIMQIDNLDKDFIRADRADFYGRIWIAGHVTQTKTFISDDGDPGWSVSRQVKGNIVKIRLKVADDDGGLEDHDDQVDICPKHLKKELDLVLNMKTGRITGDASGKRGETIHVKGAKDGDKAEIWFVIR